MYKTAGLLTPELYTENSN